ncbi:MAG: hypothetical protein R2688_10340 [Fimbriimonadaceae bacterium]
MKCSSESVSGLLLLKDDFLAIIDICRHLHQSISVECHGLVELVVPEHSFAPDHYRAAIKHGPQPTVVYVSFDSVLERDVKVGVIFDARIEESIADGGDIFGPILYKVKHNGDIVDAQAPEHILNITRPPKVSAVT